MGCPPIRVRSRVRWSASEKGNGSGAGKVSSDDPWCAVISRQYPFHLLTTKKIEDVSSDIWMAINYSVPLPNACSTMFDHVSDRKIYNLVGCLSSDLYHDRPRSTVPNVRYLIATLDNYTFGFCTKADTDAVVSIIEQRTNVRTLLRHVISQNTKRYCDDTTPHKTPYRKVLNASTKYYLHIFSRKQGRNSRTHSHQKW